MLKIRFFCVISSLLFVSAGFCQTAEEYLNKGYEKINLQDYTGAIADFDNALRIDKKKANAYFVRGNAKISLEDYKGAIADFNTLVKKDSNFTMAYYFLGLSKLKLKLFSEALIDFNKVLENEGRNSDALDGRAETRYNLNDFKGCIEDSEIALTINPEMPDPYFLMGMSYYKLGKTDSACKNWIKAKELGKEEASEYVSKYCKQN